MNKTVKIILAILLFAATLFFGYMGYATSKVKNSLFIDLTTEQDQITLEYANEKLDALSLVKNHGGELTADPAEIDLNTVQSTLVTYTVSAKGPLGSTETKTKTLTVNVQDTVYPVLVLRTHHYDLTVGDTFDPEYNIFNAYDMIDGPVVCTSNTDLDLTKEGEYTVTVTAEDKNHNITTDSYTVTVGADSESAMHYDNTPSETKIVYEYTQEELDIISRAIPTGDFNLLMKGRGIPELAELVQVFDFDTAMLPRYLMLMREQNYSAKDAVKTVNNNEDYIPASQLDWSAFYHNIVDIESYTSITANVNIQNRLPADYVPEDLVNLPNAYWVLHYPMRKVAADAIVNMSKAAQAAGYGIIRAQSNYRSYSGQANLYNNYVSQDGVKGADKYSARPGHSEHQTGLVTDLSGSYTDLSVFDRYDGYQWVMDNAHRFGYIQRYPKDKEFITGYMHESWHFRYVGVGPATIMHDYGWTLEEYKMIFD